ncbi:hypothetical protein EKO27_g9186 [Xylaria grammica]|uniref:Uncharacterized protein n=1 Tax=Xylaria grammica TaxID=363999 RepID=A0A439CUU5_9PEZI|nr:hypothetical protein EKO27_g9186 [Xylaria grammica]
MMDRNPPGTGGVLTTKPNGRKTNTQPFASRRPSRKSSGNPESKENSITSDTDGGVRAIPRPTHTGIRGHRQSDSLIEHRFASQSPSIRVDRSTNIFGTPRHSRNTRIPRPATTSPIPNDHHRDIPEYQDKSPDNSSNHSSPMRQPMDLKAAWKRAQEQTAAEAQSDSDNTIDLQQAFNMANAEFNGLHGIDGSPSPAPRPFRREFRSTAPPKNGAVMKNSDLNKHLERFDRSHQLAGGDGSFNNLSTKNQVKHTVSETSRTLAKKVSGGNQDGSREPQRLNVRIDNSRNQDKAKDHGALVKNQPAEGAYSGRDGADVPVPSIEYESASDDRPSPSFQPTKMSPEKSMNWHLDADFTAGDLQISDSPRIIIANQSSDPSHPTDKPVARQTNDKLSQIYQRELEAARMAFPEDTPVVKQMNHKLEEIRAREMEALSRRALASSRLDEIRIKNSEPRSESSEIHQDPHKKPLEGRPTRLNTERHDVYQPSSNPERRGEPIHDAPVMVFKKPSDRTLGISGQDRTQENKDKRGVPSRSDSHDLLRRLARATSSSPQENSKETEGGKEAPFIKAETKQLSEVRNFNRSLLPQEGRIRNLEIKNSKDRPTVGFADLMRIPSSDSVEEKRTSMPTSEADPTDRIAAELNLFAPLDNYSEKGSIRAPSPVPSEPVDEKTPRPPKVDPLTQPTPRVSGAYVDTPATVRVKGEEGHVETSENPSVESGPAPTAQGGRSRLSPAKRTMNTGATSHARSSKRSGPRSSSVPTASRRSRSSSRRRRPLINTAKPPTVREDILAILRANNIDDSTLENLDSILADHEVDDLELKQMVNDTVLKIEDDLDVKFSEMSDHERELEAYTRMSKSLQTGLLGIRSAKKGIERLEDKVTHNSAQGDQPDSEVVSSSSPPRQPPLSRDGSAPAFIPVPRLYRKDPKFKLTTLGVVALCAIIWYVLECVFYSLYAGPEYICTPSVPCDWSPHEPYFPYTMPFMLDEWVTGGKGRVLALRVGEEVGDIWAEVSDWATNTDFTQFDERYMNVWQRKRHSRRLRKHGLIPRWTEPPGYKARYPDWQLAKAARELAQELELEEDETMSADEIVR